MEIKVKAILTALVALALVACSDSDSSKPVVDSAEAPVQAGPTAGGIPWYEGSIERAFAEAKAADKPVFLYWGADWCPPCHELKATIFLEDRFIAQSRMFVPVYLDGDTDQAQQYGEQFGVMGYPTVIIFSPAGEEITRIPGGMDIDRYVGVLELALNALHPVSELLVSAQAGKALAANDWKLLANYSWSQDRGRALGEQDLHETMRKLALACPIDLGATCTRLRMMALNAWLAQEEADPALAEEYRSWLDTVMADEQAARDNLQLFIYSSGSIIEKFAKDDDKAALRDEVIRPLLAAEGDERANLLLRLDSLYGWLDAQKAVVGEEGELSSGQQEWLQARVETHREKLNSYQRHAALNTIWQLYYDAGLEQPARDALEEGIATSSQPYYFMSGMGYIEREAGNPEAAIDWYRKSWQASSGQATRIQWGSSYLRILLTLSPDDLETIGATGDELINALKSQEQGLAQRNSGGVRRIGLAMEEWLQPTQDAATSAEQRGAIATRWRGELEPLCDRVVEDSYAIRACASFMGEAPAEGTGA
jgi:thioredoxin-related protein